MRSFNWIKSYKPRRPVTLPAALLAVFVALPAVLLNGALLGQAQTNTVSGAPTGLTATASGMTTINLSWTAPASDGAAAISGYKIPGRERRC